MNHDPLNKYFDFNEADLFANRNGYLTSKQITRMATGEKFTKRLFLTIALVLFGIAILPSAIMFFSSTPRSFMIIWGLLWIPTWGFFGVLVTRMALSTRKVPVLKKVEGPINIVMDEENSSTSDSAERVYELHVGGEAFDVDSELADVMMQGDVYAVYYIEDIKEIMSAEMLAKGK